MNTWVEAYSHAPINTTLPKQEIIQHIKNAEVVLASSLSRTTNSLAIIGVEPTEKNSLFDEVALPEAKGTWLKLSSKTWLVLLRLMMLAGFGKKSKVYTEVKQRATEASEYLIDLANKHESIALLGHGGMNFLIGKELKAKGFKCTQKGGGNSNWSYKIYS